MGILRKIGLFLCAAALMGLGGCGGGKHAALASKPDLSPIWPQWAQEIRVGNSVKGTPITMYVYGKGPEHVLIFGNIHGNEWTSYSVARNLVMLLDDRPDLYYGKTVGVIITANPDGLEKMCRTNANGVDINRNFPAANWELSERNDSFGGEEAGSEPETQAVMAAVEMLKPARIVSIHSIGNDRHGNNFDGPGEDLANKMATRNGYKVLKSMGYPTPGSFGTWVGIEQQIPTITLELPRAENDKKAWEENREALLAAID